MRCILKIQLPVFSNISRISGLDAPFNLTQEHQCERLQRHKHHNHDGESPTFAFLGYFLLCFQHLYVFQYIHSQMKAKFTVDDHRHYLFTPCILTEWVLSLLRYNLTAGNKTHARRRFQLVILHLHIPAS